PSTCFCCGPSTSRRTVSTRTQGSPGGQGRKRNSSFSCSFAIETSCALGNGGYYTRPFVPIDYISATLCCQYQIWMSIRENCMKMYCCFRKNGLLPRRRWLLNGNAEGEQSAADDANFEGLVLQVSIMSVAVHPDRAVIPRNFFRTVSAVA